ncbi:hypothetical protein [Chlorobium sp. N1]|uniref:hypothetical protein n=1 Tax=Chlorobium sp. N1 TaxID=2491138 RepID=UPI00103EBC25|nr:hypothetical protein [Chlorobium sp. N1]TCD47037.1 hypothetical protein E0L29_10420 [Chlorobium sp. N1]
MQGEERLKLQERIDSGDIPRRLSPFGEDDAMIPELSVGIRQSGRVVAWMCLQRSPVASDAICYRSLYVDPLLRTANGLGPIVAAEAFQRHASSDIAHERPKGVFNTHHRARKQMNFVQKRLLPCCFETYALHSSELDLRSMP